MTDGYLGNFHILVIMNNAAASMGTGAFAVSVEIVELLPSFVVLFLIFSGSTYNFNDRTHVYNPPMLTNTQQVFMSPFVRYVINCV